MGKIARKWIQLDWGQTGALRAQDIPFDSSHSLRSSPGTSNPSFQLDLDGGGPVLENVGGELRVKQPDNDPAGLRAGTFLQEAAAVPSTPSADEVVVYISSSGSSPKTVKWACKLEDGSEVILASLLV